MAGYHKYVFDIDKREFVGSFEEMYQNEQVGNFDLAIKRTLGNFKEKSHYLSWRNTTFNQ